MNKIVRYVLYGIVVLVAVGCEAGVASDPAVPPTYVRPTVPLKKRPIVPTTKLPRPRVVEFGYTAQGAMVVTLAEGVDMAMVDIITLSSGEVVRHYVMEPTQLLTVPTEAFEIVVEVDGEVESYLVE